MLTVIFRNIKGRHHVISVRLSVMTLSENEDIIENILIGSRREIIANSMPMSPYVCIYEFRKSLDFSSLS